jgi:very-short-patch-repair endonuclease
MRKDAAKEDYLKARGIRLLRIANGLVMEDPQEFLRKVRDAMASGQETTPHPSRDG